MGVNYLDELDTAELVNTDIFTGVQITKVFTCPPGEVDAAMASGGALAKGTVLPAAWGGPETPTLKTARLAAAVRAGMQNGQQRIITTWLELN